MSQLSMRLKPEELRSLAFGAIGGAYADLGSPLSQDAVIFHIQNATNAAVLVSLFKQEDHEYVAAGGFLLLDVSANRSHLSQTRIIRAGTQVQIKEGPDGAPTSGSVYLSTFYADPLI